MRLGIYGSGGLGREVKEITDLNKDFEEVVFIDDTVEPDKYYGIKRIKYDDFKNKYSNKDTKVVIAVGDPKFKKLLYDKVKKDKYKFATIIDPTAYVSPTAKIGDGVIIEMRAYVGCDVIISDNVGIMGQSCIGHDTVIESHSQISARAVIGGICNIKENAFIGLNSTIKDRTTIGNKSIVSMGAAVFNDVKDNMIVLGNPAREIGINKNDGIFKD